MDKVYNMTKGLYVSVFRNWGMNAYSTKGKLFVSKKSATKRVISNNKRNEDSYELHEFTLTKT